MILLDSSISAYLEMFKDLNWLHVAVAGIANFAIGSIWFAPPVFGNAWMKELGITKEDAKKVNMVVVMGGAILMAFVMAITIGMVTMIYARLVMNDAMLAGMMGAALGGGLIGAQMIMNGLFEMRSFKLICITVGHTLVCCIGMTLILLLWK